MRSITRKRPLTAPQNVMDELNKVLIVLKSESCAPLIYPWTMESLTRASETKTYPTVASLDCIIGDIRKEKFRLKRESGENTPEVLALQNTIDTLKRLKEQTEITAPRSRDYSLVLLSVGFFASMILGIAISPLFPVLMCVFIVNRLLLAIPML